MLDPFSGEIGACIGLVVALAIVFASPRRAVPPDPGPQLAAIKGQLTTMSAALDALKAAADANALEVTHAVSVLEDINTKLQNAIAGGNDDPAIQAVADEISATTAQLKGEDDKLEPQADPQPEPTV